MQFMMNLNPIWNRGGQICPGRHKPVCHFRAKCARVTKIHDFVPFHVRLVLEKLFFKFSNFFWKYWRSLKISKGGTLLCKNQKFQKKYFFFKNPFFSTWKWIIHELSFLLRYMTHWKFKIFTFSSFFAWKMQILTYHVSLALAS